MNAPTERDVKKLFALSLNQCAFPNCLASIFGLSDEMLGEICHIKARNPEGPRYDPLQSDGQRHGFDNLILLCRNHHKTVDDNPSKYTVDWLQRIKREHEANGSIELSQHDAALAKKLLESLLESIKRQVSQTNISQTANGKNITQIGGDLHYYEKPPKQKIVVTPPAGSVSASELHQLQAWIETLVGNTVGKTQSAAYAMWYSRFKRRFKVTKIEQLPSAKMADAEAWYRQQTAIQKRGLRTKLPDAWRNSRYAAIHSAIKQMGVNKLVYYAEISARLKMKKPFDTLTKLTKVDLERVYTLVLRDAKER